jgi:hypothetical protein
MSSDKLKTPCKETTLLSTTKFCPMWQFVEDKEGIKGVD